MSNVPNPDTRIGTIMLNMWTIVVGAQVLVSVPTFFLFYNAFATFSLDNRACFIDIGTIKLVDLVLCSVLLYHPFIMLNICNVMGFVNLLYAGRRVRKFVNNKNLPLDDDEGPQRTYFLIMVLIFAIAICFMVGTLAIVFSLAFLPMFVFSSLIVFFVTLLIRRTRKCRSDDRSQLSRAQSLFSNALGFTDAEGGELFDAPYAWLTMYVCFASCIFYGFFLAYIIYAGENGEGSTELVREIYADTLDISLSISFMEFNIDKLLMLPQTIMDSDLSSIDMIESAQGFLTVNAILGLMKGVLSGCFSVMYFASWVSPAIPIYLLMSASWPNKNQQIKIRSRVRWSEESENGDMEL